MKVSDASTDNTRDIFGDAGLSDNDELSVTENAARIGCGCGLAFFWALNFQVSEPEIW